MNKAGPPGASKAGGGRQAEGRNHPEHRRPAPDGREPGGDELHGSGPPQLLHPLRKFYSLDDVIRRRGVPLRLRRHGQAGRGAL